MATRQELEDALRKAHAAGNTEHAAILAKAIRSMEAAPQAEPEGFSVGEMASNFPRSAMGVVADGYNAVTHPVETTKAVGNLAAGAVEAAAREIADFLPGGHSDNANLVLDNIGGKESFFDQFVGMVGERYGSIDKALQTLEKDPAGVMVDLGGVLGLGGAKAASVASNPVHAPLRAAKVAGGKALPKGLPHSMYESAAKFSTVAGRKERAALVDTALKNKVAPTYRGVDKLEGLLGDMSKRLDDLMATADKGVRVPVNAIYQHISDVRKAHSMGPGAPAELAAIEKRIASHAQHLAKKHPDGLSVDDLQSLKREIYAGVNYKSKQGKGAKAKQDTDKAVATGAKEKIENHVPGVKEVNSEYGKLLELEPHLARAAGRNENRNFTPLDGALNIAAGSTAGAGGAVAGAGFSMLGMPKPKAAMAQRLYDLQNSSVMNLLGQPSKLSQAELMLMLSGRYQGATGTGQ